MKKFDWVKVYQLLENVTPLLTDCGQLCNKQCCSLEESGQGVFLFPGEDKLFETENSWCHIKRHISNNIHYTGRNSLMLDCSGQCPREKRPLVCRLFPMAPYLNREEALEIIFDPDAYFICPLSRLGDYEVLDKHFLEKVRQVWLLLVKEKEIKENVWAYSQRLDDEAKEPWKKLLGQG
jgi:hypothetical protein